MNLKSYVRSNLIRMSNGQLSLFLLLSVAGLIGAWAGSVPLRLLKKTPGPQSQRGLSIYGGNTTYIEDHPYLVSVLFDGVILCAGTILSRSWVFLSADCLNGYSISNMEVITGSRDGMEGTHTYTVSQSVSHPDYNFGDHTYNYGLIQINGNFSWGSKVRKARLPKHSAKAGTWLTMTGYGASEANGVLRAGRTQVLSKEECRSIYAGYTLNLTSTVGCLYNKGKTTICSSDSADPVTKNGVLYHITTAIGTTGYCSSEAMPVITSNVYGAVSWIKKTIGIK